MRRARSRSKHSYSRSLAKSTPHGGPASSSSSSKQAVAVPYPGFGDASTSLFNSHAPVRPSPLATHDQNGMPLEIWDRLKSFPLFTAAPDGFLTAISKMLRPQIFSPQEYILTEGDHAKAMYWIVRGAVAVTSRDGESVYAELSSGAFFGEIGILFNIRRTASVLARSRCMVVVLTADALQSILPQYPEIEHVITQEAQERLNLLIKQKTAKKSPLPSTTATSSLLETPSAHIVIRDLLKTLVLFQSLPPDVLHTLALSVEPKSYQPFEYILRQNSLGREIFFIVSGAVEIVDEATQHIKARLNKGAHFGEVGFLSLAPTRTASVRSVGSVQCLVLTLDALNSIVMQHDPTILQSIEQTARQRMATSLPATIPPSTSFSNQSSPYLPPSSTMTSSKPLDPDPFTQSTNLVDFVEPDPRTLQIPLISHSPLLPADSFDRLSLKSSSPSLSPPSSSSSSSSSASSSTAASRSPSPSTRQHTTHDDYHSNKNINNSQQAFRRPASETSTAAGRINKRARRHSEEDFELLPDSVLIKVFQALPLIDLVRAQLVCLHWRSLVRHSSLLLHELDLSPYNTLVYDSTIKQIARFARSRPKKINISNCFHLSDDGFSTLVSAIGKGISVFKMSSVWEVSGMAILELTASGIARTLEELDLSNCRKVGDGTLARVVGWVVPPSSVDHGDADDPLVPPAGTIVGCPNLKRLSLSYCKHISDKSMHHLARHANTRLESLDLTRCTSITDTGFHYWSTTTFPRLKRLCLADCTFLTDKAIVSLTSTAKALQELDLSFCCALSDVSVEVLSLGCPLLRTLNLSFCGSAVSDSSLRAVGRHLLELRTLSVRGCVRVTNSGVDAVSSGCVSLTTIDISQCRNVNASLHPLLGMVKLTTTHTGTARPGGSGKLQTYGCGEALWNNKVMVIY
ncbi:hypothetical protein V1514DRAFT_59213 [Lipomyces japonicus]|uniref:uncharacterized protein n=1 Tax=Lipomyces japonicus TaxID=56871 RepID=UPI0034CF8FC5